MKGMAGMGLSAAALVAGAIIHFAVTATGTGFSITKIGTILMIAGAIGFVISSILFLMTRDARVTANHSTRTETSDSKGNSVVTTKEQS